MCDVNRSGAEWPSRGVGRYDVLGLEFLPGALKGERQAFHGLNDVLAR
ncbi:hypothetical protein ACQR1I_09370 [Bradyrhizobium sp. HKCCYLS2038]